MDFLLRISRAIDGFNTFVGRSAAWAIAAAILVSAVNAIIRKLFGVSSNAWLELQWYLFGAVFMFCAPWALATNDHIRIDILSSKLSPRTRNIVEMFGHFFFLLPFCVILLVLSYPFFVSSYLSGETSSSAGGLIIWPAKAIILVGVALLLLQWVSEVIKRAAVMQGLIEDPHTSGHHNAAEAEAERLLALSDDNIPATPTAAPQR